jgi:hypothetical protein
MHVIYYLFIQGNMIRKFSKMTLRILIFLWNVIQILTYLFDKNFWNSKIAKNNENPKKYIFNIFASFLAFLASSKKEFKFSKVFRTRSTFHASFFKIIIFLIWVDVDIARFQKNTKKLSKIKIYKKTKLRDQVWIPNNFFTYK